jgi:hypothetical protein
MAVVALDTHAVVKELQAAGFSEAQAEAVTRAVRKGQDLDLSGLATAAALERHDAANRAEFDGLRKDIEALRKETRSDIESLRKETKADIDTLGLSLRRDMAEQKADLLKWLISAIGLQTIAILGAIFALVRLLPR